MEGQYEYFFVFRFVFYHTVGEPKEKMLQIYYFPNFSRCGTVVPFCINPNVGGVIHFCSFCLDIDQLPDPTPGALRTFAAGTTSSTRFRYPT